MHLVSCHSRALSEICCARMLHGLLTLVLAEGASMRRMLHPCKLRRVIPQHSSPVHPNLMLWILSMRQRPEVCCRVVPWMQRRRMQPELLLHQASLVDAPWLSAAATLGSWRWRHRTLVEVLRRRRLPWEWLRLAHCRLHSKMARRHSQAAAVPDMKGRIGDIHASRKRRRWRWRWRRLWRARCRSVADLGHDSIQCDLCSLLILLCDVH